ncbi:MAG: hypothetical protein P8Y27_04430 [Chromatiaceae bacterium]|jgi:hypothetical protein
MTDIEKIELARYHREILEDLRHLVKKYGRIMEWDVAEVDEKEARTLIFQAMRDALAKVEAEG